MRAVIHAGMPKTGSSSIQQTFSAREVPGWYYPALTPTGNHSRAWLTMFEDDPETAPVHRVAALTADDLDRRRTRWVAELERELAVGGRHLLMSAERISKTSAVAAERGRDWLARWFTDITVVAYVRPPVAFMASAFQQSVRGLGVDRIGAPGFWPAYRDRFEKLDACFGRDHVLLRPFDADVLHGHDVVLDLAHELGVAMSPDQVVRANDSLSLEAVALLFTQRKWGTGYAGGFIGAPRMNNDFVDALRPIGSSRLAFSRELVAPWLVAHRHDVEWIEDRLGRALLDEPSASGRLVSSELDLLDIALENADALAALVGDQASSASDVRTRVLEDLETLRLRHFTMWVPILTPTAEPRAPPHCVVPARHRTAGAVRVLSRAQVPERGSWSPARHPSELLPSSPETAIQTRSDLERTRTTNHALIWPSITA